MTHDPLDDAAAEHLLRGLPTSSELEPLAVLLSQVRNLADTPPTPTPALAALLRDGFPAAAPSAPAVLPSRPSLRRRLGAVAGLSLAVKVLTGTGVAVAGMTAAASAGVLPEPLQEGVTSVIRTLTPFDVEPPAGAPASVPATTTPGATPSAPPPAVQQPMTAVPTLPAPAPVDEAPRATPTAGAPDARPTASPAGRPGRATPAPATPAPAPQERPRRSPGAPEQRPAAPEEPRAGGPGGAADLDAADPGGTAGPDGAAAGETIQPERPAGGSVRNDATGTEPAGRG